MPRLHEFAREERFPSYWANRIQDFLSGARTDLRVSLQDSTHVRVIPVEPYGIAAIDLQGLWRFRETSVVRAHPGGAAGTYTVWAVATKQKVVEAPKPFTDETNDSFDLRITSGANPAGEGVEVFEKIAEVDWDGAEITALRQTYNAVTGPMIADGAFAPYGDLEWNRAGGGGLYGNVKANAIGSAELADLSVDTAAIVDLAVTEAKIAALAITSGKLAANSVINAKIVDLAVTAAKIAALSITEEKLAVESVSVEKIQQLAVTVSRLAVGAVTGEKISNFAVTAGKIAAAAVTDEKLASPNNSVYRNLLQVSGSFALESIAGTWVMNNSQFTAGGAEIGTTGVPLIGLKAADYAVAGKTAELSVLASIATNSVASGATFGIGLYPVTVGGTAGHLVPSLAGGVVKEVAIAAPAASSIVNGRSADFVLPADGAYALGVKTSAKLPAGSAIMISASLQIHHV